MKKDSIDGVPILGDNPQKRQPESKIPDKKVAPKKDKTVFKCMDCNFKFRDFEYKERPRCPYCANHNTVKADPFFREIP